MFKKFFGFLDDVLEFIDAIFHLPMILVSWAIEEQGKQLYNGENPHGLSMVVEYVCCAMLWSWPVLLADAIWG